MLSDTRPRHLDGFIRLRGWEDVERELRRVTLSEAKSDQIQRLTLITAISDQKANVGEPAE
jgi:hypothetical protein